MSRYPILITRIYLIKNQFISLSLKSYIDQLTVTGGIRPACELLNVATLAARFSFDVASDFLADSGPNNVAVNGYNYVSTSGLKLTQAISFSNSPSSYMQTSGFRFFSYINAPFSLTLWIQPILLQGTLVGSSLGYDPLTFASNGSLIAFVGTISISYGFLLELAPIWSHIALTWSPSGGLKLYVNNQLVASTSAATSPGSGASTNSLTLGGGTFAGTIDEWHVYSRELTSDDVCAVFAT
jgi:hypothetical protein